MSLPPPDDSYDPFLWDLASKVYLDRVRRAHEDVSSIEIDCDEIDMVMDEVRDQSDRGAAILIFSFVETILHRSITLHFDGPVRGGVDALLQPNAAFGTASSRLSVLAALSWLQKETYESTDLLRKIRNHFAHNVRARSFNENPVLGWVTSLPRYEKSFERIPGLESVFAREQGMTTRHLFLLRATFAVWNLITECALIPYAQKHLVDPGSVRTSAGDLPENLAQASRRFSRAVWMIIGSFAPGHFERTKKLLARESHQ